MPLNACRAAFAAAASCLAMVCALTHTPAWASSARSPGLVDSPARRSPDAKRQGLQSGLRGGQWPYQAFEGQVSSLERGLFADAADGRLDRHTPLAAALIASGLTDAAQVRHFEDRLETWIDELARSQDIDGTGVAQAAAIFEFMHRRILVGGYNRDTSDLGEALTRGRFNCASSSLLYYCLAMHFGLAASGLELPGHAMVRLVLPDRTLDVETTCPRWFQLLDDLKAQAQLRDRARGSRPGADPRPREVTPIQMAAMIYYNRGIDLLAAQQYPEALAANAKALRLDRASVTARGNLLATLNNWSIRLGESGKYAESAERLEQGLSLEPHYPAFAANYAHVNYEWIHSLCHAKRFAEAVAVLQRAIEHRPADGYFRRALADVHRRWATWLLATAPIDEALAVFDEAYRRFGRQPDLIAAEMAASNDRALELLEQGRFQEALAMLDRALARQPGAAVLDENRRVALMRWAEPAFQEGDYAEAIRRTTYGAQPGGLHESLLNNVRYGYEQWLAQLESAGRSEEARRVAEQAANDPFLAGR